MLGGFAHNVLMSETPRDIQMLKVLGEEIRRRRKARGVRTLRQLKELTGISTQFLSQIENAYVHPSRGYVIPSDETLGKLSAALEVPISRLHAILGRIPEQPYPIYVHPEAAEIAEEYDHLPAYAQRIVRDALTTAKAVVEQVEQEKPA